MGKADSLSRRPDWEVGVKKDNKDKTLVKPEWLEIRRMEIVEIIVDRVDLLEKVRKSKVKDDKVVKAIEEMKKAGVKMLRDEEWREVDSVMYKEGKVYVPKDDKLQAEIIRLHHDTLIAGHGGQWKTIELVTQNFWWLGITREVKQYVEGCDACQQNKNRTEQPASKLMPNSIPKKPWICHKLHLAISPPILRRFPRSQSELKALKKTFRLIPVMSRSDQ